MPILNKFSTDLYVFLNCVKKIDKTRFHKLMRSVAESIICDSLHPDNMDINDNMFIPTNNAEMELWCMYRNSAKKDMRTLLLKTEKGKMGGRPPKLDCIQDVMQMAANNLTANKAKDCILIDETFSVADYDVFKPYITEMPHEIIESVEKWLIDKKNGQRIQIGFITKQFINFAKRQNKPLFK